MAQTTKADYKDALMKKFRLGYSPPRLEIPIFGPGDAAAAIKVFVETCHTPNTGITPSQGPSQALSNWQQAAQNKQRQMTSNIFDYPPEAAASESQQNGVPAQLRFELNRKGSYSK